MFVARNDVEGKLNNTYFCNEDGAFHWKGFLVNGFIEDLCKEYKHLVYTLCASHGEKVIHW